MMDTTLSDLGSGVILAWIALPIFALSATRAGRLDAASHCRALTAALFLGGAAFALPLARTAAGAGAEVELPGVVEHVVAYGRLTKLTTPLGAVTPLAVLGAAWLLLVAVVLLRALVAARALAALLARADAAPDPLVRRLARLAAEAGVRPPRLLLSDEASVPFAASAARPAIVLPRELAAALPQRELDLVLAHELAHVTRGDLRAHALSVLPRALFVLHPTARRLLGDLRLARELAVDAHVGAGEPAAYAKALLHVARHARFGRPIPGAIAMHESDLARRIAALCDPTPARRVTPLPALGVAAVLAVSAFVAPRLSLGVCPLSHKARCAAAPPCPNATARTVRL